jgi:hypothetical protein
MVTRTAEESEEHFFQVFGQSRKPKSGFLVGTAGGQNWLLERWLTQPGTDWRVPSEVAIGPGEHFPVFNERPAPKDFSDLVGADRPYPIAIGYRQVPCEWCSDPRFNADRSCPYCANGVREVVVNAAGNQLDEMWIQSSGGRHLQMLPWSRLLRTSSNLLTSGSSPHLLRSDVAYARAGSPPQVLRQDGKWAKIQVDLPPR